MLNATNWFGGSLRIYSLHGISSVFMPCEHLLSLFYILLVRHFALVLDLIIRLNSFVNVNVWTHWCFPSFWSCSYIIERKSANFLRAIPHMYTTNFFQQTWTILQNIVLKLTFRCHPMHYSGLKRHFLICMCERWLKSIYNFLY